MGRFLLRTVERSFETPDSNSAESQCGVFIYLISLKHPRNEIRMSIALFLALGKLHEMSMYHKPTRRVCMQLTQLVIKDGVVCVTQHETAPIYHV